MLPHLIAIGICLYLLIACFCYLVDSERYEEKGGEVYIPLTPKNIIHYCLWPYTVVFGR